MYSYFLINGELTHDKLIIKFSFAILKFYAQ